MARFKKFGKICKRKLKENATKARHIRQYTVKAKQTLKANASIVIEDNAQGDVTLAKEYLSILISDIKKHNMWYPYKVDTMVGKGICLHSATIGSSQIIKLPQESFRSPKRLHARLYKSDSRVIGAQWERYFEKQIEDSTEPDEIKVHDYVTQKTAYSTILPWICATPDYIARVSTRSNCRSNTVVIEIKSTKSEQTFKSTLSHHSAQVKTAIDCFGLKVGYLITYLIKDGQDEPLSTSVHKIRSCNYLASNFDRLTAQYATFLSDFIHSSTHQRLDPQFIEEELRLVPSNPPLAVDLSTLNSLPSFSPKPPCVYQQHYCYKGDKTLGKFRRLKLSQKKFFNNLIDIADYK